MMWVYMHGVGSTNNIWPRARLATVWTRDPLTQVSGLVVYMYVAGLVGACHVIHSIVFGVGVTPHLEVQETAQQSHLDRWRKKLHTRMIS